MVRLPAGNTNMMRPSRGERMTNARPPLGSCAASTTMWTPKVGRKTRPSPRKASEKGPVALTTTRAVMVKRSAFDPGAPV